MPKNKRQHFVSQGVIRFWSADDRKVTLWERGDEGRMELRNPRSVLKEDYLYSTWDIDGTREDRAEHHLASEVDNHAPALISELIGRPVLLPLSQDERLLLSRFAIMTMVRNPAMWPLFDRSFLVLIASWIVRLVRRLKRKGSADLAYSRYGKERVIAGDVISKIVQADSSKSLGQVNSKSFLFLTPSADAPNFVLGSVPFLIKQDVWRGTKKEPGKPAPDATFTLVLHPRLALCVVDDDLGDRLGSLTKEETQGINGLFIKRSRQVIMLSPFDADGAWFQEFGKEQTDEITTIQVRQSEPKYSP